MSHVTTVDLEIKDLDALAEAAKQCGCELVRGQTEYKWFGEHVGDYPMPEGFKVEDLGKCQHAIRVVGNETAYEIGVVERYGKYLLLFDFWRGGHGLCQQVCHSHYPYEEPGKLMQEYSIAVATKQLRKQGHQVERKQEQDGQVRLVARARM